MEILLVAPYQELSILAEKIRAEMEIPFDIVVGNLDETWERVNSCVKKETKIIVSRGGTAQFLGKRLHNIPIVDIPVTSFDILNAISKIDRKKYKKIAFITTSNIIMKTEHFNRILDFSLSFEPVIDVNEIHDKVIELANNGFEVVVGDVVATIEAKKNHLHTQLLESGYEALVHGLKEAQRILAANKKERARICQMEAILNMIYEGVLAIDEYGQVTWYNNAAEKVFGHSKENVIANSLEECIPESKLIDTLRTREAEKHLLTEIQQKKILTNRIPIVIDDEVYGAVAIFEEVSNIQKLELNVRTRLSEKGLIAKHTFSQIQADSPRMKRIIKQAQLYAASEGTVLLYGETGSGKELFAQSIHNASKRTKGPFVSVNCAALSESLLESELFGYSGAAFTGASKSGNQGLFELAHGGTIFLDEIGEISSNFQAKLLRVLQEKEIRKVGGKSIIPIDVRVICATNRSLKTEVLQGRFREDLYYRLAVLEIGLPALRERCEDIIPMAALFLKQACLNENKWLHWRDDSVFSCLCRYEWHGNARELQNFIKRLVICAEDSELTAEYVENMLKFKVGHYNATEYVSIPINEDLKMMESFMIERLLDYYEGDKERICQKLGISKTTLWRKLKFQNKRG